MWSPWTIPHRRGGSVSGFNAVPDDARGLGRDCRSVRTRIRAAAPGPFRPVRPAPAPARFGGRIGCPSCPGQGGKDRARPAPAIGASGVLPAGRTRLRPGPPSSAGSPPLPPRGDVPGGPRHGRDGGLRSPKRAFGGVTTPFGAVVRLRDGGVAEGGPTREAAPAAAADVLPAAGYGGRATRVGRPRAERPRVDRPGPDRRCRGSSRGAFPGDGRCLRTGARGAWWRGCPR